MADIRIPNYQVRRNDRGFWEPTKKMRALGFSSIACGVDGPDAWAKAELWNARWQAVRRGDTPSPALVAADNLSPERSEKLTIYPPRSLGDAFRRYRGTNEWSTKAPRTREDWWRAWKRIKPVFGDVDPRTVTLETLSAWRQAIEESVSLREAHRARLLRSRCRSVACRSQPHGEGTFADVDRGRGRAACKASVAHGLSWPRCRDRGGMGYADESRRRASVARLATAGDDRTG
jgi:hypothetical protein